MIELSVFGEGARFHHLGIAVGSIRDVSAGSEPILDPIQKVAVAFVGIYGLMVELVEPCGEDSPIKRSLEKGTKLVHLCYAVPDLQVAIRACRKRGFHRIGRAVPAVAFDHRKIAWVYSNDYGLFELLEEPGQSIKALGRQILEIGPLDGNIE